MKFFSRDSHAVATVAINLLPRKGSWGGANQWTTQLSRWLQYNGWKVQYDLKRVPDAVVMTHTGLSAGTSFGVEEVARLKEKYPQIPCIHRINDNDLRKESSEMDQLLERSNRVADHTVFVSAWLRDHHAARWFDASKAHSVIVPGADARFFHPIDFFRNSTDTANCGVAPVLERIVPSPSTTTCGRLDECGVGLEFGLEQYEAYSPASKSFVRLASSVSTTSRNDGDEISAPGASSMLYTLNSCAPSTPCTSSVAASLERSLIVKSGTDPFLRLVTHHWSDNWNKGFDIYQQIDELIALQTEKKFELWVIGRWPKEIRWKSARTFPPASGAQLAMLLRQCHGYVSASRYEPGAMHVAEGLQCGLPLLYHRDSGGTVEQGLRYGMEIQENLETTLTTFAEKLPDLRQKLLADPPSGSKMAMEYQQLLQRLIVTIRPTGRIVSLS
ncbi:MAG: hypothetical protein A3F67_09745 [Verrucomicrobia bacterium RIFCSPHIGHO2_12_FULL_41_10]|nr:MAG: hypothetical protein A3F67_09745 [Verrucomicrobia bacterium RIFCSPHIGHO2_12_FULL_41_10]HLB33031.1 hypothetical protein [Chthoniobacterales bacterium]